MHDALKYSPDKEGVASSFACGRRKYVATEKRQVIGRGYFKLKLYISIIQENVEMAVDLPTTTGTRCMDC